MVWTTLGDQVEIPLAFDYSGLTTQAGTTVSRPFAPVTEDRGRADSETNVLREVIVHCPGGEIARPTPTSTGSLFPDDVLNIPRVQTEYDVFTATLRSEGVIVYNSCELFVEVLAVPETRRLVPDEVASPDAVGISASELFTDYFQFLSDADLAEVLPGDTARTGLRRCLSSPDGRDLFSSTYLSTLEGLFVVIPLSGLFFTRDAPTWLYGRVSVNSMTLEPRRREAIGYEAVYRYHPALGPCLTELVGSGALEARPWCGVGQALAASTIEGGDFQTSDDRTLVMSLTHRPIAADVERLASQLSVSDVANWIAGVYTPNATFYTQLETVVYLDILVTMISPDTYLCLPDFTEVTTVEIEPVAAGRFLQVMVHEGSQMDAVLVRAAGIDSLRIIGPGVSDEAEALCELARDSCNVVTLAPGCATSYAHNQCVNDALHKTGIEVVGVPGVGLARGRGSSYCMICLVTRSAV